MKWLAWDTSSKAGTIVAVEWTEPVSPSEPQVRLIAELSLNVDATHSEQLLWGIHQVLESARWTLKDVDGFGVGIGPGSFTGLRIGITTARTLSHTFQKPLIGVSSLAALARPMALLLSQDESTKNSLVIAVTDACKGELFALWGTAQSVKQCVVMAAGENPGLWMPDVQEQVIEPRVLMQEIQSSIQQTHQSVSWIAVGEGRNRYLEDWKALSSLKELRAPLPYLDQVQGRYLGLLLWEAYQSQLARDGLEVHPRYLRASDAELKLKAGLLRQAATRG